MMANFILATFYLKSLLQVSLEVKKTFGQIFDVCKAIQDRTDIKKLIYIDLDISKQFKGKSY